jgi:hypothetical protein
LASSELINLASLIDDEKCFELIRQHRWPDGVSCPGQQIARELDLNDDDVHAMASALREGLLAKVPEVKLEGVVEIDEVYVVAGHKGNPAATQKKAVPADAGASRERRAAALWKRRSRPSSE